VSAVEPAVRVLVLDDDPGERALVAASLRRVEAEYELPRLEVEARGTPAELDEVVRRLESAPDDAAPWDIILSDVLMPDAESGGLRIARTVRGRWGAGPVPVQVALVTAFPGYVAALDGLNALDVAATADWLWFFAKGEEVVRSPAGELLSDDAWRRALAHLVLLRGTRRWGLRPLQDREVSSLAGRVFRSPRSTALLTQTTSLGGVAEARVVMVVGEPGSGRELVARLLHFHRMRATGRDGAFVAHPAPHADFDPAPLLGRNAPRMVSQTGAFTRAAGGTLFVDDAQNVPASVRAAVAARVRLAGSAAQEGPALLVLGVEPGPAVTAWREALGDVFLEVVEVPPLRERREDVAPAALALLARYGAPPRLDDGAMEWLADPGHLWPRNFATLETLLLRATDYGQKRILTAAALQGALAGLGGAPHPVGEAESGGAAERILFVSALPDGEQNLRADRERREIRRALAGASARPAHTLGDVPAASLREMLEALRGGAYTLLHFAGHGTDGGLLFEARSGAAQEVNRQGFAELVAAFVPPLRCVFLNACHSHPTARALSRVVPHTVAVHGTIADDLAVDFAAEFYQALARGLAIPAAFEQARRLLRALSFPGEGRAVLLRQGSRD